MFAWDRGFEFDALGRTYVISREPPANALASDRAAGLVRDRARQDHRFRAKLVDWACHHALVWTAGDELQIVDELVRRIAAGMVRVHERAAAAPVFEPPAGLISGSMVMPKPLEPSVANEIVEDLRALQITHCPPQFDPREAPLRVSYMLRDLHGQAIELVIRSAASREQVMHRRALAPAETLDGAGSLEWDGRADADGEFVHFDAAPFVVELVHDARYRDEATTTIPPSRERLRYAVPDYLRFDNGSALLLPAPWTHNRHPLAAIVRAYLALVDEPDLWLAVVGHASAPAGKTANQRLSEHRAEAVRALVENDEHAWVDLAQDHGSLRDVIAYLDYLGMRRGWPCSYAGEFAELGTAATDDTRGAVEQFQAEYNARFDAQIDVDGICGKQTLAAVFRVLYWEFERWLAKLDATPEQLPRDRVVYLGHGERLAGRDPGGEDPDAADRVVDLLLIEAPAFDPNMSSEQLYAIADRQPFEIDNDDWATGPFTIVSDLTPEEPALPETYRLVAHDGTWAVQRVLPEDGEVESGELVLRFEGLPTELKYRLVVISHGGRQSEIFSDVPYPALWRTSLELG